MRQPVATPSDSPSVAADRLGIQGEASAAGAARGHKMSEVASGEVLL